MISKSFTIQAFIALIIIIAFSLTSSVNAAAMAPAGFSRDRRADSVPAPVMARFNEKRQDSSTLNTVQSCAISQEDVQCLYCNGVFDLCNSLYPRSEQPALFQSCIEGRCDSNPEVVGCLTNSAPSTGGE